VVVLALVVVVVLALVVVVLALAVVVLALVVLVVGAPVVVPGGEEVVAGLICSTTIVGATSVIVLPRLFLPNSELMLEVVMAACAVLALTGSL
jgi:hypothetical protein